MSNRGAIGYKITKYQANATVCRSQQEKNQSPSFDLALTLNMCNAAFVRISIYRKIFLNFVRQIKAAHFMMTKLPTAFLHRNNLIFFPTSSSGTDCASNWLTLFLCTFFVIFILEISSDVLLFVVSKNQ